MKLKDIVPYLDVIVRLSQPKTTFEVETPDNGKYIVFFYQASEFEDPYLFVCIIDPEKDEQMNTIIHYGMKSNNSVLYEKNSGLPSEVKNFVSKLVKLLSFM